MAALVAIAVVAALAWLFIEKREEREKEGERERPAAAEARLGRSPAGESTVMLDLAAQQQLGLRDTVLLLRGASPELRAYGQVLDPSSLVTLDGDLSAAEATVLASKAVFERARTLRQSEMFSPADYDAAEARYHADESRRRQAEQQMAAEWGDWISTQPPADRHALIEQIAERRTAFARVSLPAGEFAKPQAQTTRIEVLGHEQSPLRPKRVLDAPSTDPRTPGPSFLLLFAPTGFPVRPGDAVTAFFSSTGTSVRGVVIPRDAAVRYGGKVWVFMRMSPEQFVRREVSTEQPTGDGWLIRSGFAPGERLVVVGAQALLSEQFKSQIQIGEEGGEEKEREEKDRR
jgi:hypothetical protein